MKKKLFQKTNLKNWILKLNKSKQTCRYERGV